MLHSFKLPTQGTPTSRLRAMTNDQLVARYQQVRTAQAAPNYVPQRLRPAPSASARRAHSLLQSERTRIQRIARERNLELDAQPFVSAQGRDPYSDPQRGDTVETEFRDPDTREIVRDNGIVEKIESGKFGIIYHTRVNGKLYPLSKRGIKKIVLDS